MILSSSSFAGTSILMDLPLRHLVILCNVLRSGLLSASFVFPLLLTFLLPYLFLCGFLSDQAAFIFTLISVGSVIFLQVFARIHSSSLQLLFESSIKGVNPHFLLFTEKLETLLKFVARTLPSSPHLSVWLSRSVIFFELFFLPCTIQSDITSRVCGRK